MRFLEPSKWPCSCAEEIWSGEWVATWADSPRKLSPGQLQFSKLFWPSSRACSWLLAFFTPSYQAHKHAFSSVGSLDPPNSACFGAERSREPVGSGPATGASLYHATLPPMPAFLFVRSLEPSKRLCSHAEKIWSSEWVAPQPDGLGELSPGPLQFPKLFWPSRCMFLAAGFLYPIPLCPQTLFFICGVIKFPKHSLFHSEGDLGASSSAEGPKREQENSQVHSQQQQRLDQDVKTLLASLEDRDGQVPMQGFLQQPEKWYYNTGIQQTCSRKNWTP